jgi:hypothetical protein
MKSCLNNSDVLHQGRPQAAGVPAARLRRTEAERDSDYPEVATNVLACAPISAARPLRDLPDFQIVN